AGLIGQQYTNAFNLAVNAGAQDVANEQNAWARQLSGANQLFGMGTGATNLSNTLGTQQTQQDQAGLNALYNQWLMAQQYPFLTTQNMDAALGAARAGAPTTTTNTATNPLGWGLLGSVGGSLLGGPVGGAIGGSLGSWLQGGGYYGGSPETNPNLAA